ncbi:MAG: RNA methyltransferase, partial [Gammaproteobacteria bacterium]
MSSNINIVLVNTSHPGNIGSTARAMKTMGLNQLTLVSPKDFPSIIANAKAVGCTDILDNAKVTSLLSDAVSNSKLIVGFSARSRKSNIPSLSIDELNKLLSRYDDEVSIIFGNEQSGLSNEDLRLCNYIVAIPTDKAYSSLNLAFAVQIFSYEFFKFRKSESKTVTKIDTDIAKQSTKNHLIEVFLSIM